MGQWQGSGWGGVGSAFSEKKLEGPGSVPWGPEGGHPGIQQSPESTRGQNPTYCAQEVSFLLLHNDRALNFWLCAQMPGIMTVLQPSWQLRVAIRHILDNGVPVDAAEASRSL
jgi:hypothetical protein